MNTIQNVAMFQGAATVVAPPSGRGSSTSRPAENAGGFAQVLSGRWSSREDADAAATSPVDRSATEPAAELQKPKQMTAADDASPRGGEARGAIVADGLPGHDMAKGAAGEGATDLERKSLAAEAQQTEATDPSQHGKEVSEIAAAKSNATPVPGRAEGAVGEEVATDLERQGLAAGAQQPVADDPSQHGKEVAEVASAKSKATLPSPGKAKGWVEGIRNGLMRKSLAAEAQQVTAADDTATGVSEATVVEQKVTMQNAGPAKGADREADGNDDGRKSLAAGAQHVAAVRDLTQLDAAGTTMVTAGNSDITRETGAGRQAEVVLAQVEQRRSLAEVTVEPVAVQGAEQDTASAFQPAAPGKAAPQAVLNAPAAKGLEMVAMEVAGKGQDMVPTEIAAKAQEMVQNRTTNKGQQEGSVASGAGKQVATAEGFVPMPVAVPSFQPAAATSATGAVKQAPADTTLPTSALEPQVKDALPEGVVVKVQPEVAKLQSEAATPATAAVADGTQKEVPVPAQKGEVPAGSAPVPEQLSAQLESVQAEVTASTAQGVQRGADRTDTRTAQGARKAQAAESGMAGEAGVTPALSAEEASGSKNATASASSAKSVPLQANLGQSGSGDAGKGTAEHKAQGKGADQVQPMGLGVQDAPVAEAAQPEVKPASSRSALHDSILSQIKDGVVTHDGKGSSQISIRLNPGELGELKIQVRMEDSRLSIEVHAENRMVKDLLMSNLDTLKEALSGKNFTMEGFDVSTGGDGFQNPLPEERGSSRQQAMLRNAKSGGYPGEEEGRVNYVTEEVNNLLDVRF